MSDINNIIKDVDKIDIIMFLRVVLLINKKGINVMEMIKIIRKYCPIIAANK